MESAYGRENWTIPAYSGRNKVLMEIRFKKKGEIGQYGIGSYTDMSG